VNKTGSLLQFACPCPEKFIRPVWHSQEPWHLCDGDLYLNEIGVADLNVGITQAIREAIACFRSDLYMPCIAMLFAGIEGAWKELAESMLNVCEDKSLRKAVENEQSIKVIINVCCDVYKSRGEFKPVCTNSGVKSDWLAEARDWSHVLRESRNVLHWGTSSFTPNNYEKVASILLGVGRHLRNICNVRRCCK
jgi:hypothetical protein